VGPEEETDFDEKQHWGMELCGKGGGRTTSHGGNERLICPVQDSAQTYVSNIP
jgi:hypothetical protein